LGEIVRRHVDFVFGVARRTVRDPALAEDVTQAVFLILARKANEIHQPHRLSSWLFKATRYTAANAMKMAARRTYYERQASRREESEMNPAVIPSCPHDLNDALASLPAASAT